MIFGIGFSFSNVKQSKYFLDLHKSVHSGLLHRFKINKGLRRFNTLFVPQTQFTHLGLEVTLK